MKSWKMYLCFICTVVCFSKAFSQGSLTLISEKDSSNTVYSLKELDSLPQYPGGATSMMTFIMSHVEIPQSARDNPPSASMKVEFIIRPDGSISNIHTVKSTGNTAIDQQIMKAIEKMPVWKPGYLHGKAVSTVFQLPIACLLYK